MSSNEKVLVGPSILLRLTVWYTLVFVVGAGGFVVFALNMADRAMERQEKKEIIARVQRYQEAHKKGGVAAIRSKHDEYRILGSEVFFIRILGSDHKPLPDYDYFPDDLETVSTPTAASLKRRWLHIETRDGSHQWEVTQAALAGGLTLQVGKDVTDHEEVLSYFRNFFHRFVLPLSFFGLLVGFFITYRAVRPIRKVIEVVQGIQQTGDTTARVPSFSFRGEATVLVLLFNRFLDRINLLLKSMRDSLDNVAHDLRTPMARLRASAEIALQNPQDCESLQTALGDCLEESEKVLTMLETLMTISEAEAGAIKLDVAQVSIPEVIHDTVDLYQEVAEDKGVTVSVDAPKSLSVQADPTRLRQVMANLLDNAIKYSPDGGAISIVATENNGNAVVSIKDQGIGIASDEIERIWERLYRGDRSRSWRGLGLGLSLVRAIVEAHGGNVGVESVVDNGATFRVSIPKQRSEIPPNYYSQ